jgi:hypothetical protein
MVTLFAAAMFINALLLFLVQPMFARLLLPLFGGSPAVWTTCMLFFQSALLAGYAYSHSLVKVRRPSLQALIHVVVIVLPLVTLPIAVTLGSSPAGSPIADVLRLSTIAVGAPFFALATSAPLLQRWFAAAHGRQPVDPYFLYAASNVGSFASLILYPTVVEPVFALSTQTRIWGVGYSIAAAVTIVCAVVMWRRAPMTAGVAAEQPDGATGVVTSARRVRWIALAFVPSSLMLAVTAYLSTDVAAVPLLWVIPLALYLVTFVITFSMHGRRIIAASARAFPLVLLILTFLLVSEARPPFAALAGTHLLAFFVIAILCHAALADDRPPTTHLTDFYLCLSVGGALGGVFNSLLAPLLFRSVLEYPFALAAGILLLTFRPGTRPLFGGQWWWVRPAIVAALTVISLTWPGADLTVAKIAWMLLGVAIVVCFGLSRHPRRFGVAVIIILALYVGIGGRGFTNVVHASRTFFGTYRVTNDAEHRSYTLFHGTTIHGQQNVSSDEPLTYYHRESPIGQVFATRPAGAVKEVGAVGLGIGTLAAYVQPGQRWIFYEIDPEVERIARDDRYFTHLRRCGERCHVVIGDARLSLQQRTDTHDVIVLDAFSSDAIPIHLLTREAVELYLSRLHPGGILAIHISNNHLNLAPVVAGIIRDLGLVGRVQYQPSPEDLAAGRLGSQWAVVARDDAALGSLADDERWAQLRPRGDRVWTDDFSNLWSAIQWRY